MKKTNFILTLVFSIAAIAVSGFRSVQWEDCDGCEYEKTYKRDINGGDDKVYNLYCRKTGNDYTIYKRKNGKWERQGEDKEYEECDLVKFMCDCKK